MALSPLGGSNLDINSIVAQLMAVEERPLTRLTEKEASYKARLSAVGNLKSSLSAFQTALRSLSDVSKFQSVKASVADTAVATASASAGAAGGTFTLEVSKLAQAQKLASAGQASAGTPIGTGTITFDFGSINVGSGSFDAATGKYTGASFTSNGNGVKTVTIGSGNASLSGIRDAINAAGIGVTASIVNDGSASPHRLVLTEQSTGKTNSMKISVSGDAALASLMNHDPAGTPAAQGFTETSTAQNAELKVDGIAVSKPSNTINDVMTGVTLTLNKTNVGSPTNVSVTKDASAINGAVGQFVAAYNVINQALTNASSYNPETKVAAVLNGDATVRSIQTQLRAMLITPIEGGGAFKTLSQIGVSVQKDGNLAVDNAKLQKAVESNFSDIAALFTATGKATDSLVAYSGSTEKTKAGSYDLNISRIATKGKTTGSAVAALTIGASNDTLEVKLDGVTATIKLAQKTYASADALALEIQSKINGVAEFVSAGSSVSVSQTGGRISILSSRYGSGSNISITGGNGSAGLLGATPVTSGGEDVAGTLNGVPGVGAGQFLTGAAGSAADGLKLLISGGSATSRGTVSFSKGYAYQFDKLVDTLLAEDGPINAKTDGINASLKSLDKQKQQLNDRLDQIEKRYKAQFSALDTLLSSMGQTSSYLTQQLASLSSSM
ncbi:MAG TPA: flagellar filament capping protein FliD [Noviherbaspirillum sp.]|uniref:flagellar filament capping protein FliD n=1 Tax=Noviherbaspirillum sp. TaxID=1926288 RepID=UPI002F92E0BF